MPALIPNPHNKKQTKILFPSSGLSLMNPSGDIQSKKENIANPIAPSGTSPNSIRPAEMIPASTLPTPIPITTAINNGVRSDSIKPPLSSENTSMFN